MKPGLARQIAEAMECTPELLPFLPELLADWWELGGQSHVVLDLLRQLGLPPGARVLDLGCGKGAVLLALAEELDFHGVGVDAFAPFIEEAQRAARARGLVAKCKFCCADLCEVASEYKDFDIAMMLALGAAIGTQDDIVGLLRCCVRPGGYLVIDDSFLAPGVTGPLPGYESYSNREETLRRLTTHGDWLVQEYLFPQEQQAREIQAETEKIRRRAEKLMCNHPEAAELIRSYVARQEREGELARSQVVDATWLLQRRD